MRQWGVNNLHKVVAQQRHGRKSAYRLATAPPRHYLGSDSVVSVRGPLSCLCHYTWGLIESVAVINICFTSTSSCGP